ncbi:MAG: quinoprotein dehydrogenase-associated SoxYZ-like carrier [Hyphomicrobium sp.]|jgi:sulfur-oxidizing protein SoxY|uniref:quinoprotein dehydrogenase-associated SoxYZ-like carrier n=3 Tax=Hyphomicrobium TaxID=81 RepID=UPI0025C181E6|nr:quinoprotein dehydrogenase-associated SoxYZ-like carrier [Hyphomicrobium sp.]MBX9861402.1 quinoprotein dehydrogenase-associated SoxYZ-like carrier [Hyphomicrobium sp.]
MRLLASTFLLLLVSGAAYAAPPSDPLGSPMWADMVERVLEGGEVVFDDKVKVVVPSIVENQAQVPVTADARALPGVTKLVVFADLNPIQHVLTLTPGKSAPYIGFRMKVEQGTPVRAAAQTADGVWHVGSVYLDAAGGGCSAPAMARNEESWSTTVGQTQGRIWRDISGLARARFRIRHPMDTGLARDNTPAFYIESVKVTSSAGAPLATLQMFEPVSEDPTVTLMLPLAPSDGAIDIEGRDINGGLFRSQITAPWRQSNVVVPRG